MNHLEDPLSAFAVSAREGQKCPLSAFADSARKGQNLYTHTWRRRGEPVSTVYHGPTITRKTQGLSGEAGYAELAEVFLHAGAEFEPGAQEAGLGGGD